MWQEEGGRQGGKEEGEKERWSCSWLIVVWDIELVNDKALLVPFLWSSHHALEYGEILGQAQGASPMRTLSHPGSALMGFLPSPDRTSLQFILLIVGGRQVAVSLVIT